MKSYKKYFCTKKLSVKCWWNWHLDVPSLSLPSETVYSHFTSLSFTHTYTHSISSLSLSLSLYKSSLTIYSFSYFFLSLSHKLFFPPTLLRILYFKKRHINRGTCYGWIFLGRQAFLTDIWVRNWRLSSRLTWKY